MKVTAIRRFYGMLSERQPELTCPFGSPKDYSIRRGSAATRKAIPPESISRVLLAPSSATPAGIRDRAMLSLIVNGLGVDEIHRLNTSDVDLAAGRLRVVGRAGRVRSVILLPGATAALRTWMAARALVASRGSALFVSLNHNSNREELGRMSTRSLRQAVDRCLCLAGSKRPGVSARALRISAASAALTMGALQGDVTALTGVSGRTVEAYRSLFSSSAGPRSRDKAR